MEDSNYSTSILSLVYIDSAILLIREINPKKIEIDLNLNAIPSLLLSVTSLEAFVNEVSSIAKAFLKNKNFRKVEDIGISKEKVILISKIKEDPHKSFYERYKCLLKILEINEEDTLQKLNRLGIVRNAITHYRDCDIEIREDDDGVIKIFQDPPDVFNHLKRFDVKGFPLIGEENNNTPWIFRISTNAMAIWSLKIILESILLVLRYFPSGDFQDHIKKFYQSRQNKTYLFENKIFDLEKITNTIFK